MISKKNLSLSLLLAAGSAMALGVSACAGGDDDDDDGTTPPPFEPDRCLIDWYSLTADEENFHAYRIDMPVENWADGTGDYSDSANLGAVFYKIPLETALLTDAEKAGIATNGTFTVTSEGDQQDDAVTWEQSAKTKYYDFDFEDETIGASLGSGGVGDFDGVWSDPDIFEDDDAEATFGDGTVTFSNLVNGSNLGAIGTDGALGACYEESGFASSTPANRIGRFAKAKIRKK